MSTASRGLKYVCQECTTRYYDMKKSDVACPQCGTKPPARKVPRADRPGKKTSPFSGGRKPQNVFQ